MDPLKEDLFVETTIQKSLIAAHAFGKLNQEKTDNIVRAVYECGFNNRWKLAEHAYKETGIGILRDKVIKISLPPVLFTGISATKKRSASSVMILLR